MYTEEFAQNSQKGPNISFADVTLRDGHQSHWGTMMLQEDIMAVAPHLAKVGFASYEVFGGATTHTAILNKGQNPFKDLQELRQAMPDATFSMLLRGQNVVGYKYYADDVVDHFIEQSAEFEQDGETHEGVHTFRIFDAHNYLPNIRHAIEKVKVEKEAGKNVHAQGAICFSISENPHLGVDDLIRLGHQMKEMGYDSLCIKDMAGRATPEQAKALIKGLAETGLPLAWHSHTTFGSQNATMAAMRAAVEAEAQLTVDTATLGLSGGFGHVDAEALVYAMLQDEVLRNHVPDLNLDELYAAQQVLLERAAKYHGYELPHDPELIALMKEAQVPGGMITNLMRNVREQVGADSSQDEFRTVLKMSIKEFARIRKETGHPSVVTPSSQNVGSQAVINAMEQRRVEEPFEEIKSKLKPDVYAAAVSAAQEKVRYKGQIAPGFAQMVMGHHGRLPGPVNQDLQAHIQKKTGLELISYEGEAPGEETFRAADDLQPELPDAKELVQKSGIDPETPEGQQRVALAALYPNDFGKVIEPVDPKQAMAHYPEEPQLIRTEVEGAAAIGNIIDIIGGNAYVEIMRRIGELTRINDGTYEGLEGTAFEEFEKEKLASCWYDTRCKLNESYEGSQNLGAEDQLKRHIQQQCKNGGVNFHFFENATKKAPKPQKTPSVKLEMEAVPA